MDWMYVLNSIFSYLDLNSASSGTIIVVAAACSVSYALINGGVINPWSSYQILVPLIIGLVGLMAFLVYEFYVAQHPLVSCAVSFWVGLIL
jgi:hypothetical protein